MESNAFPKDLVFAETDSVSPRPAPMSCLKPRILTDVQKLDGSNLSLPALDCADLSRALNIPKSDFGVESRHGKLFSIGPKGNGHD